MLKNVIMLLGGAFCFGLAAAAPIEVGAKVPAVKSIDQEGKAVDLGVAVAKGTSLVYFYPKASTSG